MEEFINLLFNGIVTSPDEISIEVSQPDASGAVVYTVGVAACDMGRVIGKSGRMVRCLKTLFKAAAARQGQNASLEVK